MSFPRWFSAVPRRSRAQQPARRRRSADPASSVQTWTLEERLLLSRGHGLRGRLGAPSQAAVWVLNKAVTGLIGPYTLNNPAPNASSVLFLGGTSPNTPGMDWGNVPTKTVTFTNTSNPRETIYPFLYSPNNSKIYDPIDTGNDEYRLYIGYEQNGRYILGLPPRRVDHDPRPAGLLEWRTGGHCDRRPQPASQAR